MIYPASIPRQAAFCPGLCVCLCVCVCVCARVCSPVWNSGGSSGEALSRCRKSEPMMVMDGEKGILQQERCQSDWGLAKYSREVGK